MKRFNENLRDEVDGAALYRLLADAEPNAHLKEVYQRLAVSEGKHLALWESKLREAGAEVPAFKPSLRVKALGWLARRFGTQLVTPIVTRMERAATTMYDTQPEAIEHNLPREERSHARLFGEIAKGPRVSREGLDIALRDIPDLVLLDLDMPVMDGHAFLEAVKNAPSLADVTVVVLSGASDARVACEAVKKPLRLHTLLGLIDRVGGVVPHAAP